MFDLSRHPYFTEWTDPKSGVRSYVLSKKLAPVQQSFYFTNSSLSNDERYLWFYAAYPPSPRTTRMLGVVCLDPDDPFMQVFPETVFGGASPLVTPEGDGVYYSQGTACWLFRLGHGVEKVCQIDSSYVAGRYQFRGATHLTLSTDEKHLLIDGQIGNRWYVALGDLETHKVEIINDFPRMYNHAQFCPTDSKIFCMAQDLCADPISGIPSTVDHRIWVMDTDKTLFYPVMPNEWWGHGSDACHEWWSRDGKLCWTDYKKGIFQYDIKTTQKDHIWKRPLCHSHCDSTRRFWCADQSPYRWTTTPCQVLFYDSKTDKEFAIASGLPHPAWSRRSYHIDPHPQFSPLDRYVVYTTTVAEGVTVALCPVDQFTK